MKGNMKNAIRKIIKRKHSKRFNSQAKLASNFNTKRQFKFKSQLRRCRYCKSEVIISTKDLFFRHHNNGEDNLYDQDECYLSGLCFRCKNCYTVNDVRSINTGKEDYEFITDIMERKLNFEHENDDQYKHRRYLYAIVDSLRPLKDILEKISQGIDNINDALNRLT
jgi:hypothetical protein